MQNKPRIAIISFHNAANYGAALQAVALQRKLDEIGYPNEYIDYQNSYRKHSYDMTYQCILALKSYKFKEAIKYILGSPFMYLRKKSFSKFYKEHLKLTPIIYTNSCQAAQLNSLFDKFIVGSDQVWNPENNGQDMAYLLDFVDDDKKKISYSSSFGISSIPEPYLSKYSELLKRFKHLAVREKDGVRLVRELSNRRATLVLDPVFLIDKDSWISMGEKLHGNFVFSYTNRVGQLEKFLSVTGYSMTGKVHYKLSRQTTLMDFLNPKVKVKYSMSPKEFIGVINSASLIIILNRPFIVILTGDKGKDERLTSLLTLLNLTDRIFTDDMRLGDVLASINFEKVNSKLNKLRLESISYLTSSIED